MVVRSYHQEVNSQKIFLHHRLPQYLTISFFFIHFHSRTMWLAKDTYSLGGFVCTFSLWISLSIKLRTSKFRNQFTNQFKIFWTRWWCPKFAPGLNIKMGIVQKVYEWSSCCFAKKISPFKNHLGKMTVWSLIYFWTMPILLFIPGANIGHHPLVRIYSDQNRPLVLGNAPSLEIQRNDIWTDNIQSFEMPF